MTSTYLEALRGTASPSLISIHHKALMSMHSRGPNKHEIRGADKHAVKRPS